MVNLLVPQEGLLQVAETAERRHFSEKPWHHFTVKMLIDSLELGSLSLGKEGKDEVKQIDGRDKF